MDIIDRNWPHTSLAPSLQKCVSIWQDNWIASCAQNKTDCVSRHQEAALFNLVILSKKFRYISYVVSGWCWCLGAWEVERSRVLQRVQVWWNASGAASWHRSWVSALRKGILVKERNRVDLLCLRRVVGIKYSLYLSIREMRKRSILYIIPIPQFPTICVLKHTVLEIWQWCNKENF